MARFLRILLAVVTGFVLGSAVNMALISLSGKVIAPPAGADVGTMEGLKASIHLFEPRHFLFPFLAHALGTLVAALVAVNIVAQHKMRVAFGIGGLFLAGGVAASMMIPAPAWFIALDLIGAYLPMAWLGARLGRA